MARAGEGDPEPVVRGWPRVPSPQLAAQAEEGVDRAASAVLLIQSPLTHNREEEKEEEARRKEQEDKLRFLESIPEKQLNQRRLQKLVAMWGELIEEKDKEKERMEKKASGRERRSGKIYAV